MGKYTKSQRIAFAKGYAAGRNHYDQLNDSGLYRVRYAARRGYKKGLKDRHYQTKQEQYLKEAKQNG